VWRGDLKHGFSPPLYAVERGAGDEVKGENEYSNRLLGLEAKAVDRTGVNADGD
jgi:hypothetical protein